MAGNIGGWQFGSIASNLGMVKVVNITNPKITRGRLIYIGAE